MIMKFQDKIYSTILQNSLDEFRTDGQFCDVTLTVDGEEFRAHKLILSAASPYFKAMFNAESSFIESKQEKVWLHGVHKDALSDILKFIYSSDVDLSDKNVFKLMEAANLFQIYALKTFIAFYLQCSLTVENCIQCYVMATLHHYSDLALVAFQFLLTNFSKVVENDEFYNLNCEIMVEIVSSKLLDVPNEESLCEIVFRWIKKDPESRMQFLDLLLSYIKINSFSVESLNKIKNYHLATGQLLSKVEEIISLKTRKDSFNQIIENEEQYNFHKFRHKAEKTVIFAIGGESSGMASQSVECFTLGFDKWRYVVPEYIIKRQETRHTNVLPPLRCARYYAAYVNDLYNVYVIGGRNSTTLLDECEAFHIKKNQWNYFLKLPEKLFASGAAFLEKELMIMGGCTEKGITDKVWKLDSAHRVWTLMPPLHFPRYFHAAVSCGGYVYVLGGYDNKLQAALKTCLKFDPGSNKWFKISEMQQARAKFGCAVVDNVIYVFGGTTDERNCLKSVERYNTFTNEWTYETPMTIGRHSFSVAVSNHEIYCLGGSDCLHFLDTVEKFSLRTKRWHCVHSMQVSRLASAAAALLVPYFATTTKDSAVLHLP